jgi:hypothetical protein
LNGIRSYDGLPAKSLAGEAGLGLPALNAGLLRSEMQNPIRINIAIGIFDVSLTERFIDQ